jgi:transposase
MENDKIKLVDAAAEFKEKPDPEVPEKKHRRKFIAKYKLDILDQIDKCTQPGQIGELLRREGLYSSSITTWRRQRDQGLLGALSPQKRGRKTSNKNPLSNEVSRLQRENERLKKKLKQAETIIAVQKKVSEILGISQDHNEGDDS